MLVTSDRTSATSCGCSKVELDPDEPSSYREVDPERLLDLVLERHHPSACPE
jgi:hypothetical protein